MDKAVTEKRMRLGVTARNVAMCGYALAVGVCELKSGVYPFALCMLAAYGEPCLPLFIGAFAASILTAGGNYIQTAVIMAIYGIQWVMARKKKEQTAAVKLLTAGVAAMFTALGELMSHNLIFEDVPRALAVFASIPLTAAALSGLRGAADGRFAKARRELGVLVLAFITVSAAGIFNIGSFDCRVVAGAFLTLWLSKSGFAFGSVCGFVCGMAAGLKYMPMLGITGLCCGIFADGNGIFAAVFSYLLSGAVCGYLLGFEASLPALLSSLAGAAAFIATGKRLPPVPLLGAAVNGRPGIERAKLSAAFSSLSQVFFTVGETCSRTKKSEICEKIQKNVFTLCESCRGCDCDKYDLVNTMTDALARKQIVMFGDLPKHIQGRCLKGGELLFAANSVAAEHNADVKDGISGLAEEYLAFSRLICSANRRGEADEYTEPGRSRRVKELLRSKGIAFRGVSVRGRRRLCVTVTGVKPDMITLTPREITFMLSAVLTTRLGEPEFVFTDGGAEMRLTSLPELRIECAKAAVSKDGETVCGDTASFFESDDGYFYSLISDGMGSGRDAELSSRLASLFMEKLLVIGAEPDETLGMLNRLLIMKGGEIFTTVDLLEIDRMSGEAKLVKAGAAPTFIYRGSECYRLEAQTPPVGIIDEVNAAQTKMKLKKGDCIVMLSDGVSPSAAKPRLPDREGKRTAAALAGAIMDEWTRDVRTRDDMSVSVVRIF